MVCVVDNNGTQLMPTTEYHARKLLKSGRAKITKYAPFTIQVLDRESGYVQPIELKVDSGYGHIGISICSSTREYICNEILPLSDEKEKHKEQKKNRQTRRNRKRYSKPRFDNRKKKKGWIAPSLQHKVDIHVDWIEKYCEVIPIITVVVEVGTFDTMRLTAIENGEELPLGTDYQKGAEYDFYTTRDAVFSRDNYTCQCCGKKGNGLVLRTHHIGYWKHDRSNRVSNLLTVCDKCHTPVNHAKGGFFYGMEPKSKGLPEPTFMNTVRYILIDSIKEMLNKKNLTIGVKRTYGSMTKLKRKELGIEKSHVNDAYAMGEFHPKHRCQTKVYQKIRRNNRCLSKFYDATYIDKRDGSIKTGKELFSGRTNRNHNLDTENLHQYRGHKVLKGRTAVRTQRYPYRPKDIVLYNGKKYVVNGTNNKGQSVQMYAEETVKLNEITLKKAKNSDATELALGDKVLYNKKTYTIKKIEDDRVLLTGLISTNPKNLKHIKHCNGYMQIKEK